jgi:hypothetical protein
VRIADDSQEYGLSVWLASMCIGGERLVPVQTCFDGQRVFCQRCTDSPRRMVCWAVKMMA